MFTYFNTWIFKKGIFLAVTVQLNLSKARIWIQMYDSTCTTFFLNFLHFWIRMSQKARQTNDAINLISPVSFDTVYYRQHPLKFISLSFVGLFLLPNSFHIQGQPYTAACLPHIITTFHEAMLTEPTKAKGLALI